MSRLFLALVLAVMGVAGVFADSETCTFETPKKTFDMKPLKAV